jgi:hypothetical protein
MESRNLSETVYRCERALSEYKITQQPSVVVFKVAP